MLFSLWEGVESHHPRGQIFGRTRAHTFSILVPRAELYSAALCLAAATLPSLGLLPTVTGLAATAPCRFFPAAIRSLNLGFLIYKLWRALTNHSFQCRLALVCHTVNRFSKHLIPRGVFGFYKFFPCRVRFSYAIEVSASVAKGVFHFLNVFFCKFHFDFVLCG